ncbi:MAG: DUF2851 family protein [Sphingobacteriales bacterium]|nr:MAG: DUF2851 family protein [Sphingobacteriales bacterium]
MTESFLHYLWKMKLFDAQQLQTTEGEIISVLKTGEHNSDAGPDFLNAKIKIGNTIWAGNIEIHVQSNEWNKHKHQYDAAYENVILHVVFENNGEVKTKKGTVLPAMEVKGLFDKNLFQRYESFQLSSQPIPCSNLISSVKAVTITSWLQRVLVERLEKKTKFASALLDKNKGDWELTFYHLLARAFGTRLNADAFQLTAEILPLQVLAKNKKNNLILESLFLGCAGWLNNSFEDEYMKQLQKEFSYQQKKHQITSIEKQHWKLLRIRPASFPTLRLVQLAGLVFQSSHLFSKILETTKISDLKKLFKADCNDYWDTHYLPDKKVTQHETYLSQNFIDLLLINTVIPIVFLYGKQKGDELIQSKALNWLEEIPPETNFITKDWKHAGIKTKSAFDSQALIQLRKFYCDEKLCLKCAIGHSILKQ